jgi:hypothetical protein
MIPRRQGIRSGFERTWIPAPRKTDGDSYGVPRGDANGPQAKVYLVRGSDKEIDIPNRRPPSFTAGRVW